MERLREENQQSKSALAYQLREDNPTMTWVEISKELEFKGGRSAMHAAKAHAFRQGLKWPVPGGRSRGSSEERSSYWKEGTLGERAYILREQEGLTWSVISERLKTSSSSLMGLALRYARSRGKPWPLESRETQETREQEHRAYTLREKGISWEEISDMIDMDVGKTKRLARAHAQRNELPAPARKPTRYQKYGQACYQLRQQGLTWSKISSRTGIKWNTHACTAAKKYAQEHNLEWPVVISKKKEGF